MFFFHTLQPPDAAASPKKLDGIILTPKKIRNFQFLGTAILPTSCSFRIYIPCNPVLPLSGLRIRIFRHLIVLKGEE